MEFKFHTRLAELKLREDDMVIKNLSTEVWKVRLANGGVLTVNQERLFASMGYLALILGADDPLGSSE